MRTVSLLECIGDGKRGIWKQLRLVKDGLGHSPSLDFGIGIFLQSRVTLDKNKLIHSLKSSPCQVAKEATSGVPTKLRCSIDYTPKN